MPNQSKNAGSGENPGFRRFLMYGISGTQQKERYDLQDQDGGHIHHKVPVPGLVAEEPHTRRGAQTAAQDGGEEQHPLRDAPAVAAGFGFVHTHQNESRHVGTTDLLGIYDHKADRKDGAKQEIIYRTYL